MKGPFYCDPQPRTQSMLTQGAFVAVDELEHYLSFLAIPNRVVVCPPLDLNYAPDIELLMDFWFESMQQLPQAKEIVTAILSDCHWNPIHVKLGKQWTITTTDSGAALVRAHPPSVPFQLRAVQMGSVFPGDCGFQVFAMLGNQTDIRQQKGVLAVDAAAAVRFLFWQKMAVSTDPPSSTEVSIGGASDEMVREVSTLLHEHGVPTAQTNQRAQEVIQAVGKDSVRQALASRRPWHQLKQLANALRPPIRLIRSDELQAVIQERTRYGKSFGSASNKAPEGTRPTKVLSPSDLGIPPGVFVHQNQSPAHQIDMSQLRSTGKGLVVCEGA